MAPTARLMQEARPLSESMLWQVQRRFYTDQGVAAWSSGAVPHVLSTGPALARAYARMVEAFAEDCATGRLGPVSEDEPLYVIELGAGSGRLGFHMLRALEGSWRKAGGPPLEIVYVLTDLAESNVAFWREHPALAPYLERGVLDVALLDATSSDEVHLELGDAVLRPSGGANPIAVVANYLLDVIPQDLFAGRGGKPVEQLVAVACDAELGPNDPGFLEHAWVSTEDRPVAADRYGGGLLDRALAARALEREGERFLFPAAAIDCLDRLRRLGAGRMLLLCGERPRWEPAPLDGVAPDEAVRPQALLGLAVHGGSFSLPMDLDILATALGSAEAALAEGVSGADGSGAATSRVCTLFSDSTAVAMRIGAIVLGGGAPTATERWARTVLGDEGPESVYLTMQGAIDAAGELTLPQLLAMIRLGAYDPYLLSKVGDRLHTLLGAATRDVLVDEALRVLEQMVDADYPLEGSSDVAAAAGQMLHSAGLHRPALEMFAKSRARRGPDPRVLYLEGRCRLALDENDLGIAALRESITLDPAATPAAELLAEVIGDVGVAEEESCDEAAKSAAR